MPHPGKIIYAHPPGEEGWQFFVVIYNPSRDSYSLRCQLQEGELLEMSGSAGEMIAALTEEMALGNESGSRVPLRAAAEIDRHEGR
jgi:hypothetical protein